MLLRQVRLKLDETGMSPIVLSPSPVFYPLINTINNTLVREHVPDLIQGALPYPPHDKQPVNAVGN